MRVNVTPAHEVRTSNLLLSLRPSICVFSLKKKNLFLFDISVDSNQYVPDSVARVILKCYFK